MNKSDIYQLLQMRALWHEITEHEAVFNMEEVSHVALPYPECNAKNLFLCDKKKTNYYMVTVQGDKRVDLKSLRQKLQSKPLTFASEDVLKEMLGLFPGAVTPFGLLNDEKRAVSLYIDDGLLKESGIIGLHPNDNTATVWMKVNDLVALLREHGNRVDFVDLSAD